MPLTPVVMFFQNCSGLSAPPGSTHPIPMIAIGSVGSAFPGTTGTGFAAATEAGAGGAGFGDEAAGTTATGVGRADAVGANDGGAAGRGGAATVGAATPAISRSMVARRSLISDAAGNVAHSWCGVVADFNTRAITLVTIVPPPHSMNREYPSA